MNNKIVYIGLLATFLTCLAQVSNLYTTIIEKSTHSLNYYHLILSLFSQIFWIIYGILNKDLPVLLLGIYLVIVFLILSITKFIYERKKLDVFSKLQEKCKKCI